MNLFLSALLVFADYLEGISRDDLKANLPKIVAASKEEAGAEGAGAA